MVTTRAVLVVAFVAALSASASAHFKLNSPTNRSMQDTNGSPQKSAPCGISDNSTTADNSVPTNVVSTLKAGATITISVTETVPHPGHYRVALAKDMASLPADPPITADADSECGSTVIAANPTMPLLGDGLIAHTGSRSGPQSMQVTLPAGMTCNNCVLQVIEFMSDHANAKPGGCFYHHCAIVNVTNEGPMDAGTMMGDDDGGGGSSSSGGCATQLAGGAGSALLVLAVVAGLLVKRRR